jgi:hypothetical protein
MSNRPSLLRPGCRLLKDLLALARLGLTSQAHLAAENLFLRKQLALYQERVMFHNSAEPVMRPARRS